MANLPTGTVTFLFTDIEGSTQLAQQYPDAMPSLLARHHEILNQSIEANNGYVFQVVGDSFAVAFHNATDALNAAVDAQRALQTESWSPSPIKVRMGLHTGFAESHENVYRGYLTLARTQRVMSCGHGGQILLSNEMTDKVRGSLPQGAALRDLGRHQLKGINEPEHLFQVVADDLQTNFPPLNSTPVAPSHRGEVFSLLDHIIRGRLIGREDEIAQLEGFWSRAERGEGHLVLLSGEPGIGKTRLVEELSALAQLRGALVLEGHFHRELGVTYLGFREALQDYLRSLPPDQVRAAIGTSAPELVKLVPEVEAIVETSRQTRRWVNSKLSDCVSSTM